MSEQNIISDWLREHGDPEVEQFVKKNLLLTEKIHARLKEIGWSRARLAREVGKKPPEVSKWLSGMHNLTLRSLVKLELALGIDLIENTQTPPTKQ